MTELLNKEFLGVVASILVIPGTYLYIRSILKGKTKPHIYTKLIWFILLSIAFFMQISDAGGPGAWKMGFSAFFMGVIVVLSIKYGTKDITKLDKFLLLLALVSIPIYIFLDNVLYALIMIIFIDIIGYIPTIRKSFNDPGSEDILSLNIGTLGTIISIFALTNYTIFTYMYPLVIVIMELILVGVILYRRKTL